MQHSDDPPESPFADGARPVAYAHTRLGQPPEAWEPLRDHLEAVARLASEFASAFRSSEWGRVAGLWHDLGKYRPEFQRRLAGSREQVEHAGLGAALAFEKGPLGLPLAFAIAGHHAGLANRASRGDTSETPLDQRIANNKAGLEAVRASLPRDLLSLAIPHPPAHLSLHEGTQGDLARRWELWIRLLFSALVDADRLATEAFTDPDQPPRRELAYASVQELRRRLDERLASFIPDSEVNRLRAQVLEDCRAAVGLAPGFFSLTGPTGSGKTLAGMAFALGHAQSHDLRRVIVVAPYTTILEQNSEVYRAALGAENVVEHHTNVHEERYLEEYAEAEVRRRLAAENWDAPVIVTTTVQFFESLFSNHPSRCRKLHNIARSVILLDEAQSLPPQYLTCLLDVMQELAGNYGCTFVISTATQPALGRLPSLPEGIEGVREIIREPANLAKRLTRVRIHWPTDPAPVPYGELAARLAGHRQVLAVVHLRRDARELACLLPGQDRYHLSALMCPAHRTQVLEQVREALRAGRPCRLVTTQLIEAGVDVDFPVVYRALAGLDSLAQAAGRCNREGALAAGSFIVFRAETSPPPGVLRIGLEACEVLLRENGSALNFADSRYFEEYFRMLYHASDRDRRGVQVQREQLNFATVDGKVNLVEDGYRRPLVVPWEDSSERVQAYVARPTRFALRRLQRYLVQITEGELRALRALGAAYELREGLDALSVPYAHLYDRDYGLVTANAAPDPEALMI